MEAEDDGPPFRITDISQLSLVVPAHIQRAIGSVVIEFAQLEHTFELMIWNYLRLPSDDGRMFTARMEMTKKIELVKDLIDRHTPYPTLLRPTDKLWGDVPPFVELGGMSVAG